MHRQFMHGRWRHQVSILRMPGCRRRVGIKSERLLRLLPNRPSGRRVYKCAPAFTPSCVCGTTNDTNKSQCVSGCTDSRYDYVGNIPDNVICNDYTSGIVKACASACSCKAGYWDYSSSCDTQSSNACGELGYSDTSCTGDWIACPFDPSAKKCLN